MDSSIAEHRMSADLVDLRPESPVAVRRVRTGMWLVVEIEGEMDLRVVPVIADVRDGDPLHVVFDLQRVTFMDCSGVAALMLMHQLTGLRGGCVRIAAPSKQVHRLLVLTGVAHVFPEFDTLEAALSEDVPAVVV